MQNWTKEQLLSAGDDLRRALNTKGFETALALVREGYTQQITLSDYGDQNGRELAYRRLCALNDLEGVIKHLAAAAREAMLMDETDDDED